MCVTSCRNTKNIIQVQNEKRKLETELEDVQKVKSELVQEAQSLETELFTLRLVVFVDILSYQISCSNFLQEISCI